MIVVMKTGSTEEELEGVRQHITSKEGLRPQVFQGVERTVIGVLGTTYPELRDEFEALPGVREVVVISKPYKLASREFHPDDTIVQVGDITIGGNEVVVMAGPCAVESEQQVMAPAHVARASGAKILRLIRQH